MVDPRIAALRPWTRRRVDAGVRAVVRPRGRERVTGVVAALAREPGVGFEALRPAQEIERPAPRTVDGVVPAGLERLRRHRHPAVFRARLPGARIAGDEPLVLTADRRAVLESTFDREQLEANAVVRRRLHPAVGHAGPHVCLLSQWSTSFFHWMLDTLPRLALLDDDATTPVVVPDRPGGAVLDSLAAVGIVPERLRFFDGTQWRFDELVFPSLVGATGNPPRWALDWVRERLVGPPAPGPRRRLYVSRADATWRRVVDEREVEALLRERGFETIRPGDLPLAGQLAAFAAAEAVVGPHGAGLVNLLAARDATVVELMPATWINGCYYALSVELGLDYWVLETPARGHHDLVVDRGRLERTLDAAGLG